MWVEEGQTGKSFKAFQHPSIHLSRFWFLLHGPFCSSLDVIQNLLVSFRASEQVGVLNNGERSPCKTSCQRLQTRSRREHRWRRWGSTDKESQWTKVYLESYLTIRPAPPQYISPSHRNWEDSTLVFCSSGSVSNKIQHKLIQLSHNHWCLLCFLLPTDTRDLMSFWISLLLLEKEPSQDTTPEDWSFDIKTR